ncbi:MAG TPA: ABC transporter ATP-binding protein [Dehalococcoidales bacterium]|nr:ABC transporter ATP-binding protein [Dehalococcoidales bacterium]
MLLEVENVKIGYGKRRVVNGVSIHLNQGEIVALIGHNGAGKTTLLKGIFGFLNPTEGKIIYDGRDITGQRPLYKVKHGITFIPQDKYIYPGLSVKENIDLGGYTVDKKDKDSRLAIIYEVFPKLKERQWQDAASLSGGERRMLGISMALITMPRLLLLDEPSLGLSPLLVQNMMQILKRIQESYGVTILLVEQNIREAMRIAQRVYVLKMGQIVHEESAETLLQRDNYWDLF